MNRIASAARFLIAAIGLVFALNMGAFAAQTFPALSGRVVDDAGILSPDAQTRLTAMSQALETRTHDQLVVVTLKSLQGLEIEQYGYQLGRAWGIGQKGKNNGVLLIIAPKEHKVRIEVGYGLEGDLTDAQSELIIQNVILPDYKKGAFDTGTLAGAATILNVFGVQTADVQKVLQQQEQFAQADEEDNNNQHGGFPIIIAVIIIWLVFGRFLWPLLFLGGSGRGGWGGGGFGGGFGGGGGFSGGGFSGGGGSFGGGGASGSW